MRTAAEIQIRVIQPGFADLASGVGSERQTGRLRIIETAQHNPLAIELQIPVVNADRVVESPGLKSQVLREASPVTAQVERYRAAVRRCETRFLVRHTAGKGNRVGAIVRKETRIRQAGHIATSPV